MSETLETPSAPVLADANHYSIEIQWEDVKLQDENRSENQKLFDDSGLARSGTLIILEKREKKTGETWEFIYAGSAMSYRIRNLKVNTTYEFRIRCKSANNGGLYSDWSPILEAATTLEPISAETIYKAIVTPGKEQLERILQTLGPGNRLLEQPDKDGNLPLMHACTKLDLGKVELLIRAGANVNNSIFSGRTALMAAATSGFCSACELLIENGASTCNVDKTGLSVLHHAIESKHLDTIGVVVQGITQNKELEINREFGKNQWTPLYRAILFDCGREIIELLLNNRANVECQDKITGFTALQMAVIRGNLPIVKLLITYGANTKVLSKNGGRTLYELALTSNKQDLINYIESLKDKKK